MILLLDTHTFLWQCSAPEKIPRVALRTMEASNSALQISSASLWEIGILVGLKRIELSTTIRKLVNQSIRDIGIGVLPIEPEHLDELSTLPFFHRDPFDRLLIAQAKSVGATIIGKDTAFDRYGIERIWN